MRIICDSGSTKADWVIEKDEKIIFSGSTKGINPVFHNGDFIRNELHKEIVKVTDSGSVEEVFFYGAGCWDAGLKNIVKKGLLSVFTDAEVFVEHDLLGAARAACGNKPGIACILGTGSNSCLYDGKNVTDNVINLG
jgi:N-acetylglucosamine kinase-like BadF-type ATPase